jgi:hypothetical protein
MKKQDPTAAANIAPGWLLVSCFVTGGLVPGMIGCIALGYFASQLAEVRTPSAMAGVVVVCVVFGAATMGILALGASAIQRRSFEAARFLALLTGLAALLTGIGLVYDYSITSGWTWKQVVIAGLVVYYFITAFVIHTRLASLLGHEREQGPTKLPPGSST